MALIKVVLPTVWAQTLRDVLEEKMHLKELFTHTNEGGQSEICYSHGGDLTRTIAEIESHALATVKTNYSVSEY